MNKMNTLVILMTMLLVGCDSHDSRSLSGSNAASTGRASSAEQVLDSSRCVSLLVDSQTLSKGVPVIETHNFKVTNNCQFSVNARLYNGGYVNTDVSALAPGERALSTFSIAAGQPRGFACRAPLQPQVSLSNGLSKRCL